MHAQNLAILKGLICVAWADGKVTSAESELIDALLQTFGATPSEASELRRFAASARSVQDVPIHELSYNDRRVLLNQAVIVMLVDGEKHEREVRLIDELCQMLRIPLLEARGIVEASEAHAKKLVPLIAS